MIKITVFTCEKLTSTWNEFLPFQIVILPLNLCNKQVLSEDRIPIYTVYICVIKNTSTNVTSIILYISTLAVLIDEIIFTISNQWHPCVLYIPTTTSLS